MTPESPALPWRERHPRINELLNILAVGLVIGVLNWLIRGGRNFWGGMLYAQAISLCIAYGIALYNTGVSRYLLRRGGKSPALLKNWPGWAWAMPGLLLMPLLGYTLGHGVVDWLLDRPSRTLWNVGGLQALVTVGFIVLISAAVAYYFFTRESLAALKLAHEQAQRQAAEAQLQTLQAQLEPHMLFNTLAHLRVLIKLRPDDAQAMLDQLIAFLRATLQASRRDSHPLSAEFERLRDYLALMQVRMGERLRPELDLPPELAELPVPPLLLQPLVENAIKHGLEPAVDGGRLRISARQVGQRLRLCVEDEGVGLGNAPASDGTGFGLTQIRERLQSRYGERASLTLQALEPQGCRAELELPLT